MASVGVAEVGLDAEETGGEMDDLLLFLEDIKVPSSSASGRGPWDLKPLRLWAPEDTSAWFRWVHSPASVGTKDETAVSASESLEANALRIAEERVDGETLLRIVGSSVREMVDVLGLRTARERMDFDEKIQKRLAEEKRRGRRVEVQPGGQGGVEGEEGGSGIVPPTAGVENFLPSGACGGVFSPVFLKAVKPLYDAHMGVENMAPLLYSLVRFTKPRHVLEVGAGYTSVFLLQALRDNAEEMKGFSRAMEHQRARGEGEWDWGVEEFVGEKYRGVLHCIDNFEHEHTTAHKIGDIAEELGFSEHLKLHRADGFEFARQLPSDVVPDFFWVDFGACERLTEFFRIYWPILSPQGGIIAVHSTATNLLTRQWLEVMRNQGPSGRGGKVPASPPGEGPPRPEVSEARLGTNPPDTGDGRREAVGCTLPETRLDVPLPGDRDGSQKAEHVEHAPEKRGSGVVVEDEKGMVASVLSPNSSSVRSELKRPSEPCQADAGVKKEEKEKDSLKEALELRAWMGGLSSYSTMTFLEPHKKFQNSFTLFMKRPAGFQEPIFSVYP